MLSSSTARSAKCTLPYPLPDRCPFVKWTKFIRILCIVLVFVLSMYYSRHSGAFQAKKDRFAAIRQAGFQRSFAFSPAKQTQKAKQRQKRGQARGLPPFGVFDFLHRLPYRYFLIPSGSSSTLAETVTTTSTL